MHSYGVCRWKKSGYRVSFVCRWESLATVLALNTASCTFIIHHYQLPSSRFRTSHQMVRLLLLLLFLVQYCCCQLKQCYDAEGQLRPDLPCDPSANVSACCGQDWICSTNFYCTSMGGIKEVGSCTDITWHDPGCPFPLSQLII